MCSTVQSCLTISSYKEPPQNISTLEELEKCCKERSQLYSVFLEAERMNLMIHTNKWRSYVREEIQTKNLKTYMTLLNNDNVSNTYEARKEDTMSHWILSLCRLNLGKPYTYLIIRNINSF